MTMMTTISDDRDAMAMMLMNRDPLIRRLESMAPLMIGYCHGQDTAF